MYLKIEEKTITNDLKISLIESIETGDIDGEPAIKIETETTQVIVTIDNYLLINDEERSFRELRLSINKEEFTSYLELLRIMK